MSRSSTGSAGRFLPGAVVGERYRIVGLLGRGGMGEVYRADDLTLDQPVALKFLPPELEQDSDRLERLMHEVKVARQVSHANVCRVYDIGHFDGSTYLSMEFIDGEDLSTLLRRIGRLPEDKAVDIARQLCAGLAAAHAQGIVHRDLKPANVMLDGDGKARITDFGLAGLASAIQGAEIHAGTPDYMAPEQLAGEEVSVKSDLYALGLLLYELFTGKRPFDAKSIADLRQQQRSVTPTGLTSHVPTLDPAIERVIGRCIDPEPAKRPESALAVAAALPGGDPLAAALAAGETPSPEIVAASGGGETTAPSVAIGSVVGVVVAMVIAILIGGQILLVRVIDPAKSAGRLSIEARGMLDTFGFTEEPVDRDHGFYYTNTYSSWRSTEPSPDIWDDLAEVRPSPLRYWYRESPRALVAYGTSDVSSSNPPMEISGMRRLILDHAGRLIRLDVVPAQVTSAFVARSYGDEAEAAPSEAPEPPSPVDWNPLFEAADLDLESFASATPIWNPLVDTDARIAWVGRHRDRPETELRVEAGSYDGQPVYFRIVAPWDRPTREQRQPMNASLKAILSILIALMSIILISALWLARRNLRSDRSDRRGAYRLSLYMFALSMGIWIFGSHHALGFSLVVEFFFDGLAESLVIASIVWVIYTALEPYVRKLWPETLISWTRALGGRWRDPLIGRHLLFGSLFGSVGLVLLSLVRFVPGLMGKPAMPFGTNLLTLDGMRGAFTMLLSVQLSAVVIPILLLFLLMLLRKLTRRQGLALGILSVITLVLGMIIAGEFWWLGGPIFGAYWTMLLLIITRMGLLPAIVTHTVANSAWIFPLTLDLAAPYAAMGLLFPLVVVALAAFGGWTSMSRQGPGISALFDD